MDSASSQGASQVEDWEGLGRGYCAARMLAAKDDDHSHPSRSKEEGTGVFDYMRRLEAATFRSGALRFVVWIHRPESDLM